MIWLIPFGIALGLLGVGVWLISIEIRAGLWEDKMWCLVLGIVVSWVAIMALIFPPICYYSSRSESFEWATYYETTIQPNAIREDDTTIYISNTQAGIWQAGDSNMVDYNNYVKITRYLQNKFPSKFWTFPVPENLKYVSIVNN